MVESGDEYLTVCSGIATLTAGIIRPDARARVLVEVQPSGAGDFVSFTLNAVVEHVADGRIRMSEESVASWAQVVAAWWFYWRV